MLQIGWCQRKCGSWKQGEFQELSWPEQWGSFWMWPAYFTHQPQRPMFWSLSKPCKNYFHLQTKPSRCVHLPVKLASPFRGAVRKNLKHPTSLCFCFAPFWWFWVKIGSGTNHAAISTSSQLSDWMLLKIAFWMTFGGRAGTLHKTVCGKP